MIFIDLDKWAFDIENEYEETGAIEPRKKRQYAKICEFRDKYFKLYNLQRTKKAQENGYCIPPSIPSACPERVHKLIAYKRPGADSPGRTTKE